MPDTNIKLPRIPSYRRHKATGQAVVTIDGQDVYLGKWRTKKSRTAYNALISEWVANDYRLPANPKYHRINKQNNSLKGEDV